MKRIADTNPVEDEHEPVNQGKFLESPVVVNGTMLTGHPALHVADADTWRKWSKMRLALLWQAVALHCRLDPHYILRGQIYLDEYMPVGSAARLFHERSMIAAQHALDGALKIHSRQGNDIATWQVRLSDYAQWAQELGMTLPPYFPIAPTSKLTTPDMWPWGTHDTVMLGHLVAAANHFWKPVSEGGNYDPERPTTAKSNKEVAAWLFKRTNSDNISKAMATILRADNLSPGPRTTHRK